MIVELASVGYVLMRPLYILAIVIATIVWLWDPACNISVQFEPRMRTFRGTGGTNRGP
jgi:hypothetical protein